jgi:hypothetical protein
MNPVYLTFQQITMMVMMMPMKMMMTATEFTTTMMMMTTTKILSLTATGTHSLILCRTADTSSLSLLSW